MKDIEKQIIGIILSAKAFRLISSKNSMTLHLQPIN
jgi:hypothetical protein